MSKILSFLSGSDPIDKLVEQYRELDREAKKIRLDADLLKAKIIQHMGSLTELENVHGHVIATYKEYEREDFDKKAFASQHPEEYKLYLSIAKYRMFKLK